LGTYLNNFWKAAAQEKATTKPLQNYPSKPVAVSTRDYLRQQTSVHKITCHEIIGTRIPLQWQTRISGLFQYLSASEISMNHDIL